MMTKSKDTTMVQSHLFKPLLRDIVSPRHAMVKLADAIDWKSFEDGLQEYFCADNGRPSCPVRLMVALHYLKYASGMSDEAVLDEWLENPYWQYFTGGIYFEHEYPTDQSTMRISISRSDSVGNFHSFLPVLYDFYNNDDPNVPLRDFVQKKPDL